RTVGPCLTSGSTQSPVSDPLAHRPVVTATEGRYEITAGSSLPPLRFALYADGAAFTIDERTVPQVMYRMEAGRGYESVGELWSPGYFRFDLTADHAATLVASVEGWQTLRALEPAAAWEAA